MVTKVSAVMLDQDMAMTLLDSLSLRVRVRVLVLVYSIQQLCYVTRHFTF